MVHINLKVVTPEKTVFEQEVYQVTLPVEGGEVTLLPHHIPYIGALKAGEIFLRGNAEEEGKMIATSGGFVEFHNNTLVILADTAERAEEIDLARAEKARREAEKIMQERVRADDEEYARVAAILEKELARVRVAKKHHSRHGIGLPE